MKITEIKKIEDCFDGSTVYGYTFDAVWTQDRIQQFRTLGNLDYFPDFPRPFFRVCQKNGVQIKGIQGDNNCRVIYPQKQKEVRKKEFEEAFMES
ncbi:MAG: hypothetical protein C4527_15015 [Candidatus Omnitrophota bacterium]|jgi:hypothetical protein|nr:MAG: hypothetical protein C4527_15015 [Candidatus Omnitrophota bacterium]